MSLPCKEDQPWHYGFENGRIYNNSRLHKTIETFQLYADAPKEAVPVPAPRPVPVTRVGMPLVTPAALTERLGTKNTSVSKSQSAEVCSILPKYMPWFQYGD